MTPTEATSPFVRQAESAQLAARAIEQLARDLPTDAGQVAALLDEAIGSYFGRAFTVTALAALHASIPVDARHLVAGARLLPDPEYLARLSAHLSGDVVGALVGAVEDGRLSREKEAVSLFLAAHWSSERGQDAHRRALVRRTRMCARLAADLPTLAFVIAAADLLQDDDLSLLLKPRLLEMPPFLARAGSEGLLDAMRRPLLEGLVDDDEEPRATRRRAVPRVGRNEPCPCGSGKKYKRCCADRDLERLRDSSDVAGVTRAELRLHLEEHLTADRIVSLRPHELARLDPRRVDPRLYGMILNRLNTFEELEALRDFVAAAGVQRIGDHLWDGIDTALRGGKRAMARSLLAMAPPADDELNGFGIRLLQAGIESVPALDMLDAQARERIDETPVDLACDLLNSPWPCLGIVVARGAAASAEPWDRETLRIELGLARDRLDLPPRDPSEEIEGLWGARDALVDAPWDLDGGAFTQAEGPPPDDDAPRLLAEKDAELAEIRRELSGLRHELAERPEPAATPAETPAAPSAAPSDPRVAELKDRMAHLRSELTQRHAERNQLRRQLDRAQRRVEALEAERERVEPRPAPTADDESDETDEPLAFTATWRVPVFGRRFRSTAGAAPETVRRSAVVLASRIAAGEANALRGVRRIERTRELYRQRVGRDYRLFFRIDGNDLEVLDLVPRKDLERTVRDLARG